MQITESGCAGRSGKNSPNLLRPSIFREDPSGSWNTPVPGRSAQDRIDSLVLIFLLYAFWGPECTCRLAGAVSCDCRSPGRAREDLFSWAVSRRSPARSGKEKKRVRAIRLHPAEPLTRARDGKLYLQRETFPSRRRSCPLPTRRPSGAHLSNTSQNWASRRRDAGVSRKSLKELGFHMTFASAITILLEAIFLFIIPATEVGCKA